MISADVPISRMQFINNTGAVITHLSLCSPDGTCAFIPDKVNGSNKKAQFLKMTTDTMLASTLHVNVDTHDSTTGARGSYSGTLQLKDVADICKSETRDVIVPVTVKQKVNCQLKCTLKFDNTASLETRDHTFRLEIIAMNNK
jgi:hypothetical protein